MISTTETLATVLDVFYNIFKKASFRALSTHDYRYYWMEGFKDFKVMVKFNYDKNMIIDIQNLNHERVYVCDGETEEEIKRKIQSAINRLKED